MLEAYELYLRQVRINEGDAGRSEDIRLRSRCFNIFSR